MDKYVDAAFATTIASILLVVNFLKQFPPGNKPRNRRRKPPAITAIDSRSQLLLGCGGALLAVAVKAIASVWVSWSAPGVVALAGFVIVLAVIGAGAARLAYVLLEDRPELRTRFNLLGAGALATVLIISLLRISMSR
jgi:hypothetical protein